MKRNTSWEKVSKWYNHIVEDKGHYYHREIIIPKLLNLFDLDKTKNPSLLDLACGQGVLSRALPSNIFYEGIDNAKSMINIAKINAKSEKHSFLLSDVTKKLPLDKKKFTHATFILALQNIVEPLKALKNAHLHLADQGKLFIVINHPCFRIPRQSHWEFDRVNKLQYRRIDKYLSSLEIPIETHPGKQKDNRVTFSYHFSLSTLSSLLLQSGFVIKQIEEWCSNKKSTGKYAQMEDIARNEFPLFLTVIAEKKQKNDNQ